MHKTEDHPRAPLGVHEHAHGVFGNPRFSRKELEGGGCLTVSFLFLIELIGIQIRKIREIREITAAFSKKTCLYLHINVLFHQINVLLQK